jgi:hypothetical protein
VPIVYQAFRKGHTWVSTRKSDHIFILMDVAAHYLGVIGFSSVGSVSL